MIRRSFFYITFVATILFLASCQSSRTKAVKLVQTFQNGPQEKAERMISL
jgi:hypothetical protein